MAQATEKNVSIQITTAESIMIIAALVMAAKSVERKINAEANEAIKEAMKKSLGEIKRTINKIETGSLL